MMENLFYLSGLEIVNGIKDAQKNVPGIMNKG